MDTRGQLCVGIDPHASLLTGWGLNDDVAGLERFTMTVVDALAGTTAVFKPQSAFFERFGSRGIAVLERAVIEARQAGALVLMDAKRGDIGSTMAAYAATYLDKDAPLFSDALTVSPFLGFESLRPALDAARISGAGVFVLALTSNPEGAEVQRATTPGGTTIAQAMLDHIAAENAGAEPLGSVGAVVGATLTRADADLAVNGPLLAPGIGAQGATPADLPALFGAAVRNVLPSVSRDVLRHGPDPAALRRAAAGYAEEVRLALPAAAPGTDT
jgi:orotidine-5'-phosphate decarboxylase